MLESLVLELRAGEGGQDSRLFLQDMSRMYDTYCTRINACVEYL